MDINQIVRIVKKLLQFWKSQQGQQQQSPPQGRPPAGGQQAPWKPQASYGPVPHSAPHATGDDGRPPKKGDYKSQHERPQHPFQGHATHIGTYHDQNPASIAQTSSQYNSLRSQALHEGNEMGRCFDEAHAAYESHDGARAKQLSTEGHTHQRRRDELNQQAADRIFSENNRNSPDGTVDLHGLYVQEAIHYTEQAIQDAQGKGLPELRLVVGKGIHSPNHVQKIKPAVEELMRKYRLSASLDPSNAGVLLVQLGGGASDGPVDLNWGRGLVQAPGSDREGCTIM